MKHIGPLLVLAVIVAGCSTSEADPTTTTSGATTTSIATTTTSTTATTTTPSPSDQVPNPSECSARDLDRGAYATEDYTPSYDGLPDAVAETRSVLIEASLACDFDTLMVLAAEGGAGLGDYDHIFWGAANDFADFVRHDSEYGTLRSLVLALTILPYEAHDSSYHDPDTDSQLPTVAYDWPYSPGLWDGDTETQYSITDFWDEEMLDRVAFVNNTSPEYVITATDDILGAYGLFRTTILEDGRWWLAGAGD